MLTESMLDFMASSIIGLLNMKSNMRLKIVELAY